MDDKEWKKALGRRLREAREAAGFDTLTAFVEASEIDDYNRASRYERGVSEPRLREVVKWAAASGVEVDALIHGAGSPAPQNEVFEAWIRSYPGAISTEERLTLGGVRFIGLKPTEAAYTAMLAALRMCLPAATSG